MNHQDTLIDTHTHLASSRFDGDVANVIARAEEGGVSEMVSIACDIEDSIFNLRLAAENESVAATVGIHPLYVHELSQSNWLEELTGMARENNVSAIGEIGLDYYHPPQNGSTDIEWRSLQRSVFEQQLQLALEQNLPVVVHQRESAADVAEVLRGFPGVTAVLHCFSGTAKEADEALSMGHYLSFTGILTFPSAQPVRDVAAAAPLDRIMVETDSPYLAPVPFRGKQCEPFMVRYTASKLAELHGVSDQEMADLTSRNARRFFRHLGSQK
ncbi:MAG: TatD family hydrolase [Verrucomicrobiales bacterium]|nr:TatD family hydrolase [Verrucomicrobiales bacterium]